MKGGLPIINSPIYPDFPLTRKTNPVRHRLFPSLVQNSVLLYPLLTLGTVVRRVIHNISYPISLSSEQSSRRERWYNSRPKLKYWVNQKNIWKWIYLSHREIKSGQLFLKGSSGLSNQLCSCFFGLTSIVSNTSVLTLKMVESVCI